MWKIEIDCREMVAWREARMTAWSRAWALVGSADTCRSHDVATAWADHCLKAFDSRFKPEKETKNGE